MARSSSPSPRPAAKTETKKRIATGIEAETGIEIKIETKTENGSETGIGLGIGKGKETGVGIKIEIETEPGIGTETGRESVTNGATTVMVIGSAADGTGGQTLQMYANGGVRVANRSRRTHTPSASPPPKRKAADSRSASPAVKRRALSRSLSPAKLSRQVASANLPPPPPRSADGAGPPPASGAGATASQDELKSQLVEMDPEEEAKLMKIFGIPKGFDTTKGHHVEGANQSATKITSKRQARQYMNRRGGFNRPLPAEINK
eukprot:jgi/Chlat1/4689/Chrsp3S05644